MSLKQQHYRRLMKEQKAKASSVQKIDHPLAKYNALGQLTCVVCTATVKTELLWSTHIQSRKHKDNVAALKSKTLTSNTKRKNPEPDVEIPPEPSFKKPKTAVRTSALPPDFFDSNVAKETVTSQKTGPSKHPEGVPTDFFDKMPKAEDNVWPQKKQSKAESTKDADPPSKNASLPEGFFDDPKRDAKARKVEYKDPELQEWEKFQKSIQKEDDVSDALILEIDMDSKEDREETEVQEQASCFLRAEKLRQRQEALSKATPTSDPHREDVGDEESDSDELDLDNLLDWRAKIS
ncbi:zinc finger protein 830-like [Halichondria panicea]|uniref:zinc finger protein 830-like n=1 Tax=Halichondria panicea TaxID=6063 RepID=UPI00312B8C93